MYLIIEFLKGSAYESGFQPSVGIEMRMSFQSFNLYCSFNVKFIKILGNL
jgi:hypothetical protein